MRTFHESWFFSSLGKAPAKPACGTCAACPAEVLCQDGSVKGQIASVMASRQPLIVRAAQIVRVLERPAA